MSYVFRRWAQVLKKDGSISMTCKAFNGRVVLEWLHDTVRKIIQEGSYADARMPWVCACLPLVARILCGNVGLCVCAMSVVLVEPSHMCFLWTIWLAHCQISWHTGCTCYCVTFVSLTCVFFLSFFLSFVLSFLPFCLSFFLSSFFLYIYFFLSCFLSFFFLSFFLSFFLYFFLSFFLSFFIYFFLYVFFLSFCFSFVLSYLFYSLSNRLFASYSRVFSLMVVRRLKIHLSAHGPEEWNGSFFWHHGEKQTISVPRAALCSLKIRCAMQIPTFKKNKMVQQPCANAHILYIPLSIFVLRPQEPTASSSPSWCWTSLHQCPSQIDQFVMSATSASIYSIKLVEAWFQWASRIPSLLIFASPFPRSSC